MKEVTTVMNVQITCIGKLTDEATAEFEGVRESYIKRFLEEVKEATEADNILLLDSKVFIREMKEETK